jgi:hypothetical protein
VDPLSYGVDWDGPVLDIGGDEVAVDEIPAILSPHAYDDLRASIDPLEEDSQYGVLIYEAVADFVAEQLE